MKRIPKRQQRLGIVVGGGPAPGINGVIGAVTIEAINRGVAVIGIYDGFKWLMQGDTSHVKRLTFEDVDEARFRGGSILHTSRENPTANAAHLNAVVQSLRKLGIQHLVTIGGDDTAFSAYKTSVCARGAVTVAHVPKTIDNDLPLPKNIPTFGFHTARHVGERLIRNLVEDACTTQRWYIVVTMGRTAGHLALGMGSASGANLTIIPEEFERSGVSLDMLCDIVEGAAVKVRCLGRPYGVAVIAEGVGELMVEELARDPMVIVKRDKHGHLRLAEAPLALILKRRLQKRADARGEDAAYVDITIGYEVRCADPIHFDIAYVQQLGWGAVQYLLERDGPRRSERGALIAIDHGTLTPIPFARIMNLKTGRTTVRRVNMDSDEYRCARACMTRLEPGDFASRDQLRKLAAAANLSPAAFRKRFGYLVTPPAS